MSVAKWRPFCLGLNVLITMSNDNANGLLEVCGMSMADKLEIFQCNTEPLKCLLFDNL